MVSGELGPWRSRAAGEVGPLAKSGRWRSRAAGEVGPLAKSGRWRSRAAGEVGPLAKSARYLLDKLNESGEIYPLYWRSRDFDGLYRDYSRWGVTKGNTPSPPPPPPYPCANFKAFTAMSPV